MVLLTPRVFPAQSSFDIQRESMVREQIEDRGIRDPKVLAAMRKVPRHLFVSPDLRDLAYVSDSPLPIGEDQTISQPYVVAFMTEALGLSGGEVVLEIGTGSGYQAAVLAEIAREVYTIEIVPSLAKRSEKILRELGYSNIHVRCGDGYWGWPQAAPFDAIIITAATPKVPPPLIDQLKVGGRLVAPVGEWFQELMVTTKTQQGIQTQSVLPVRFVPMTGEAQKSKNSDETFQRR